MVGKLLEHLRKRDFTSYKAFLKALKETDQDTIVTREFHGISLQNAVNTEIEPGKDWKDTLIELGPDLMKCVDIVNTPLIANLQSSKVVSRHVCESIKAEARNPPPFRVAENLVDFILKRTRQDYVKFLDALRESGQSNIAQQLEGGGGGDADVDGVLLPDAPPGVPAAPGDNIDDLRRQLNENQNENDNDDIPDFYS